MELSSGCRPLLAVGSHMSCIKMRCAGVLGTRTLLIFRAMGLPLLGLLMSCMPDRWPRSTLSLPAAATIVTPLLMAYAIALSTQWYAMLWLRSSSGFHHHQVHI